ncbi:uncharacterized protein LOC112096698 [Citrus clementina]|uniref:uncharacterized protein LOC112096698 n=1 Tax=Citrus clementina TaxID=85681 RepID=UPI000CED46F2|nr:uncharacterized protein LOC112096698 [Citrus x clementina]
MSNRRGKLIIDDSDGKTEDSYLPDLSRPTGLLHPSSSLALSYDKDTLEYPRSQAILHSPDFEPMGNRGGQASGSGENLSSKGDGVPEEVGDGEESSFEPSRPPKKRNLSHRMEADTYPIDYIACATTHTDLLKLRTLYNIPKEILLVILRKDDVPSQPPRGYVMMHLESFKLGARLPFQPYLARILGGMHLAPGQLHRNRWRVLSALYVLLERCGLEEPSLSEIKHLYKLRSSPKEAAPATPLILKKTNVGPSKASVPALPPPPPRKNGGEKASDKSPEVSIHSGDRSSPLLPRDQGDYLTPYQRDYGKSMGPKMVKDIESMNLSELAEYNSRLAFCYKCIMFMLKEEYPELNMSKLEAGVQKYMAKAYQGDKE